MLVTALAASGLSAVDISSLLGRRVRIPVRATCSADVVIASDE
jgi:hypothetical protein